MMTMMICECVILDQVQSPDRSGQRQGRGEEGLPGTTADLRLVERQAGQARQDPGLYCYQQNWQRLVDDAHRHLSGLFEFPAQHDGY